MPSAVASEANVAAERSISSGLKEHPMAIGEGKMVPLLNTYYVSRGD